VAPRVPLYGLVGVGLLLFLAHTCVHKLLPPPPPPIPTTTPISVRPSRRFHRNAQWRGTRHLPYMDDFMFLGDCYNTSLLLRQRVESLLEQLGLLRNQDLHRLAAQTLHFPPSRDLFFPGRLGKCGGVRPPGWIIEVFRLTPLCGSTPAAAL
jgi:hypothetical protein